MTEAFLFDLDGTLIDRNRSVAEFAPRQYRRFASARTAVGAEEYTRRLLALDAGGYGNKEEMFASLRRQFDLKAVAEELLEDFRRDCFSKVHLFSGAEFVLRTLRSNGHSLAIVTNGSEATQRTKLEAAGLYELVDVTLISQSVGLRKPDPDIFRLAARELGVEPEKCTFVGDNPERDILGAASAGMTTAWLEHGRPWPDRLRPAPDLRLARLEDLLRETD